MNTISLITYLAVFLIILYIIYQSKAIAIIGGNEIGTVERKYFGRKLSEGRVIALPGEIGVQARILGPGLHFLMPFLYKVEKDSFVQIGQDEIGIVESIDGQPVESGRIFGRSVEGHNFFQNAEAFLKNGGQKGPQVDVIPPGNYRINTRMFKVTKKPATTIGRDFIGMVNAMDGMSIEQGRLLAKSIEGHNNFQNGDAFLKNGGQKGPQIDILKPGTYRINPMLFSVEQVKAIVIEAGKIGLVTAKDGAPLPESELVAKSVEGHNNYQNGAAFLANGGQRGPQLEVLLPGTYYINTLMFAIELDTATKVDQGQVAVIISNVGLEPAKSVSVGVASGSENKIERYVVPKGYRGIQSDVLGPGTYYINKRAFIPVIIDTTNMTIDWDDSSDEKGFDPLQVVSKDGFNLKVSVKVVIRVQPEQAPYMVARIGTMDNLIKNVIHPLIDSSFRNQASATQAMEFLQDRHEQQVKAEGRVCQELNKYYVEVLSVLICQITLPESLMETQTQKVLANQRQSMFEEQKKAEEKRIDMERTKAQADKQTDLVSAEIGVQVARQDKQKTITIAEGTSERLRLEGTGEANKIKAIGEATAEAYKKTSGAIGADGLTSIEIMKLIASGNIKITPEIQMSGQDGTSSLGNLMLIQLLKNMQANKPSVQANQQ